MTNQLQVQENPGFSIAKVQVTPTQALEAYKALQEITKQVLVIDVDYGTIPGTPKPSLYKPGAENLLRFYGLGHRLQVVEQVKDWESGFFYFSYKVTVHRTSENGIEFVLSECEGSANSKEKRYRNQDPFMLVNTLQKMAIKRALVGATLQATGASGLFTQDIEDMDLNSNNNQQSNSSNNNSSKSIKSNGNMTGPITEPQRKAIFSNIKRKNLNAEDIKSLASTIHGVSSVEDLTKQQASEMITLFNSATEDELIALIQPSTIHTNEADFNWEQDMPGFTKRADGPPEDQ